MGRYLFPALMGMLAAALIVGVCLYVLYRTPKKSQRVVGPPLAGDEATEHEREAALDGQTTMNQWEILRRNGSLP